MKLIFERNRKLYFVIIIFVIIVGLSTRKYSEIYPDFFAEYGGDTLWALTAFLVTGFFFNKFSVTKTAVISLSFSYLIEISQFYHAPWIDGIRNTKIGALILGFGFQWSDIICYSVGVTIGIIFELLYFKYLKINVK